MLADDLGAPHEEAVVGAQLDVLEVGRLGEAGPAGAGVELGVGGEQLGAAADAAVHAVVLLVPVGAGEGALGAGLAGHLVLLGRQLLAPQVLTAGGQALTKDNGLLTPDPARSAPPVGTNLVSTEIGVNFANNLLNSTAALPTGTSLRAPLADIDFSTGSRSFDPSTNTLSVTNATVGLSFPAALTLNQFFPTASGNAGDDFASGDLIGTIDVTGVKLR